MVESDILQKLTKQQKQAVTHTDGPLMIVAGAGTGKTTVLMSRIAWLLEQGIRPENILALTFTEKAATDMERRLDELLPLGQFGVTISTFHGFGNLVLDQFALAAGTNQDTRVLTDTEQLLFMQERIMQFPLEKLRPLSNPTTNIRAMMSFFSRCKDELISPEQLQDFFNSHSGKSQTRPEPGEDSGQAGMTEDEEHFDPGTYQELANSYQYYQKLLRDNNLLDYGELLFRTYYLVKENAQVRATLKKQYTHILVDEYQDTNFAQIELLKLLTNQKSHLTVVGDDDQSIYRFRGASTGQMERFRTDFKPTIVTLTENFRSPQPILDAAYELIQKNNPYRLEVSAGINKKLVSHATDQSTPHPNPLPEGEGKKSEDTVSGPSPVGEGGWKPGEGILNSKFEIPLHTFSTEQKEAEWVIGDIVERFKNGANAGDHSILVRTNSQSTIFQRELERQGIPFTTTSHGLLASNPTVTLLVNFLKVVTTPKDTLAFFFLATSPLYGIPGSTVVPLSAEAKSSHTTAESLITNKHQEFSAVLQDLKQARDLIASHSTSEILLDWLKSHQLYQSLTKSDPEQDSHIAHVLTEFFSLIERFELTTTDKNVFHFLQNIDILLSDFDEAGDPEINLDQHVVKLLTIHMAKGLEFPVVYLTNLSSDRFPSRDRSTTYPIPTDLLADPPAGGEHAREERRLMYVAMTRAKQELILTRAEVYGNGGRARKPSVFLSEFFNQSVISTAVEKSQKDSSRSLHPLDNARGVEMTSQKRSTLHDTRSTTLSPHQIEDYLTCPLKYRYMHIDKLPVPDEQPLMVGTAIHNVIQFYFDQRTHSKKVSASELEAVLEKHWRSHGFISSEHEEARLTDAKRQIQLFLTKFDTLPLPSAVEQPFETEVNGVKLKGRFDAVYSESLSVTPEGASTIILDFKTSDAVTTQDSADRRAKDNLQLALYALAWRKKTGSLPDAVGLYFTSSGLFGWRKVTEKQLDAISAKVIAVAEGIAEEQFEPTPSQFTCGFCPFKHICPASLARG